MGKVRKIISGKNISLVGPDGKIKMFVCGEEKNGRMHSLLSSCDDEEILNKVISSGAYENYIKLYDDIPKSGERIFEHGAKVSWICTDQNYNTLIKDPANNSTQEVSIVSFTKIKEIITQIPVFDSKEDAITAFSGLSLSEPAYAFQFSLANFLIHSVETLKNGSVNTYTNEGIIDV